MGMLNQILENDLTARLDRLPVAPHAKKKPCPENSALEIPSLSPPEEFQPCVCGNFQQWRDAYGSWHCRECEPPRVLGMVRDERERATLGTADVSPVGSGYSPGESSPGFHVVAVAGPLWPIGGDIAFSPDTTQAERKAIIEGIEWFDRRDARRAAASEAASEAKGIAVENASEDSREKT